jgi:type IV pilus assembly protein PilB
MRLRLGEILERRGVLSGEQVSQILQEQALRHRPFGVLAEEMFHVCPRILQEAWAEQYETDAQRLDPRNEAADPRAVCLVNRRQAWQFRLLPLRYEDGDLVVCSTRAHLPRALNFAYRHLSPSCSFALADPDHLGEALQRHYPWQGPMSVKGSDLFAFAANQARERSPFHPLEESAMDRPPGRN